MKLAQYILLFLTVRNVRAPEEDGNLILSILTVMTR